MDKVPSDGIVMFAAHANYNSLCLLMKGRMSTGHNEQNDKRII